MSYKLVKAALAACTILTGFAGMGLAGEPGAYYAGMWSNRDAASGGIAQVRIQNQGQRFLVQVWGRCTPSPCPWGMTGARPFSGSVSSSAVDDVASLEANYDQGFARKHLALRLLDPDTMLVQVSTHFTDGSGRQDYAIEETLQRAP